MEAGRAKRRKRNPPKRVAAGSQSENYMAVLESWNLPAEDLSMYAANPLAARTVVKLFQDGLECSEDDPLLILALDDTHLDASMDYLNGGNYGLQPPFPGAAVWPGGGQPSAVGGPLPPGVDAAPPLALGRFILNSFQAMGVQDMSDGGLTVFKIPDLNTFSLIEGAVAESPQFYRVGRNIARLLAVPVQPVLVKCVLLTKLNGRSQVMRHFTSTG